MSPRRNLFLAVLSLALAAPLAGQETAPGEYPGLETGKMWTFDQAPLGYWAKRYNFRASQQWLDHVRQSAVRYGGGCSASFVSGSGLVMTNHHCARACVESATKPGEDLLGDGFYAGRREDERACQGLFLDQLQEITEVTDSVARAIPTGATATVAAEKRAEVIKRIEDRCKETAADAACQVVPMYRGGKYMLYRFRRYSDIRLVFAVESQTAFFGGDPDNFTYPRHDLDVSMVRAYVDGKPAVTDYLRWARTGSKEGDLVFVVGNPGSTGRLNSMAQLEYLRDIQYPMTLDALGRQIAVYQELSAMDSSRAKVLRNTMFSLQNTQKAIGGYQTGLTDPALMQQKKAWEAGFRTAVRTNAELRSRFGDPWSEIERIRTEMRALATRRQYYGFNAYGSRLLSLAGIILRRPTETAKPDADRLPAYKEANKAAIERALASTTPIDVEQETRLLTAWFTAMQKDLPASDPVLLTALRGQSPAEAARSMVAESRIKTAAERQALVDGGAAAVAASSDPFIKLAVMIDPKERDISKRWTDLVNREATQDEQVARALLAVYGSAVAPDATFSLRISDGEILRYPLNGTVAQPFTTFYGLYDRHFSFGGQEPWQLTRRWTERRDSLNLSTPFNVVGTPDIIGGNSGSPVINRDGEVVGLIFDGNIEMLPNRFLFTERVARSVWIDSRAIIEALRKVYDAGTLADELEGRT
jgi:Peptidase S46